MKFTGFKTFLIVAILFASPSLRAQGLESIYTDLAVKACKTTKTDKETGSTTSMCGGVGGYRLEVLDDDLRQSINVLDPQGKSHSLDLWSVISFAFSSLGPKAEWLVEKQGAKVNPKVLIVRLNASENADKPGKTTSYLAVIKITADKICATDKISPGATMNEEARKAAQGAGAKPCLKAP